MACKPIIKDSDQAGSIDEVNEYKQNKWYCNDAIPDNGTKNWSSQANQNK
ncbi:MAG: hypothetical protein IPO39_14400 [Bacteroidetes bacterium]|nr:hypothetical protein [Bacteroidota bacterium]